MADVVPTPPSRKPPRLPANDTSTHESPAAHRAAPTAPSSAAPGSSQSVGSPSDNSARRASALHYEKYNQLASDRMRQAAQKPDAGAHAAAIAAAAAAVESKSLLARAWRFSTSWCRQGPRVLPRLPPGMMQPDGGQESADFLERVYEMMKDPRTIETFARFDEDSSGFISTEELEKVIMMLDVAPTKGDVATMVESMDLNKDGSVDFYEFCVHMQHLRDQRSASDVEYALDQAFSLFKVDEENNINEEELARLFCMTSAGCALSPDEFAEMVEELGFKQGEGKLSLSTLRQHPCFDTVF